MSARKLPPLSPAEIAEIHRLKSEGFNTEETAKKLGISYRRVLIVAKGGYKRQSYRESMIAWLRDDGFYDDYDGFLRRHGLA